MWNYYKTVVINSATAEDGHDMFMTENVKVYDPVTRELHDGVNVWRNGQYDLNKITKIYRTKGYAGQNAVATIDCSNLPANISEVEGDNSTKDYGYYLLSFKVEMDGKFLSDWATPNYKGFYKPIVVELDLNGDMDGVATYVAEQINLALPENNKFIKVEAEGNNVVITATDNYMIFNADTFKLEKLESPSCGESCVGEYYEKTLAVKITPGIQPFATGAWLLENQRLPNSNNYRYFGFNDEMPIAGLTYTQYTFDYETERVGLGGHSGVGQGITAITNHTFFVAPDAVDAFEAAFDGITIEDTKGNLNTADNTDVPGAQE